MDCINVIQFVWMLKQINENKVYVYFWKFYVTCCPNLYGKWKCVLCSRYLTVSIWLYLWYEQLSVFYIERNRGWDIKEEHNNIRTTNCVCVTLHGCVIVDALNSIKVYSLYFFCLFMCFGNEMLLLWLFSVVSCDFIRMLFNNHQQKVFYSFFFLCEIWGRSNNLIIKFSQNTVHDIKPVMNFMESFNFLFTIIWLCMAPSEPVTLFY